jgi:hypothetical protein
MNRMIVTWKFGTPEERKASYVRTALFARFISKRLNARQEEEYIFQLIEDCCVYHCSWGMGEFMVKLEFCNEKEGND